MSAVCGVSSGAILGILPVQSSVHGGPNGARYKLRGLCRLAAHAHHLSPLQSGSLERWLFGWDLSNSLLWRGREMAMRLFSAAQLNPFGHNPLRHLLADLLEPARLTHPAAARLTVAATDGEAGEADFLLEMFEARQAAASHYEPLPYQAASASRRAAAD